jgi:D-beta-D-heptose 7-phosphate kinase/D-beta-D-heptose 1-phosphate adenosyltransferase
LTLDRLDALLERMRDVRTLVVGDLMLDVYLRGTASRISPEAPVPVVRVTEEWRALGGAANVASNVVALGGSCEVVGCVGLDRAGDDLMTELGRAGVEGRGIVRTADRPTTVKTRIMARHQQVARYDSEAEEDLEDAAAAALIETIEELAPGCDSIALEDYNKGVLTPTVIAAALKVARRHEIPVVVDPKVRNFFDYVGATVFKPNLSELGGALRAPVHYDDPAWLAEVRARLGCRHLLVTLGEEGMSLITADDDHLRVPTVARSVFDVSGAGDTVTAALATALGAGASVAEAAILANHAAGIGVGKVGVATVTQAELRETVRRYFEGWDRAEHAARNVQEVISSGGV